MKASNKHFKAAAIVSSVLLVGGFVSYRAGAFNGLLEQPAPSVAADDTTLGREGSDKPAIFLVDGTSKSGAIFRGEVTTQQAQPATAPPPRTVMSGSKSVAPLLGGGRDASPTQATQAPDAPPSPPNK